MRRSRSPSASVHGPLSIDSAVVAVKFANWVVPPARILVLPDICGVTEMTLGIWSRMASASAMVSVAARPFSPNCGWICRLAPPSSRKLSMIPRCTPSASPSIAVTDSTPMMIPSNVSEVLSRFVRNARMAVRTLSRNDETGVREPVLGWARVGTWAPAFDGEPAPSSATTRPSSRSMRRRAWAATLGSWVTRMIVWP